MQNWKKQLPMWITMSRIFAAIPIIALLFPDRVILNVIAAVLFILASISDYYDGYFARKFNAISNMGKFMDPIADKILVTSVLVMMIPTKRIDPVMVTILLVRDTLIGGIRSVAAADQIIIAAKPAGKWKTALQMVAIPAVMIGDVLWGIPFDRIGYYVLWVSVVLSVTSGIEYTYEYLKSRKSAVRDT